MMRDIKKAMRESILEKEKRLGEEAILSSNSKIAENLFTLPEYMRAKVVFSFVGRAREVDTKPIILDALSQGKRVCAPRCASKGIMRAYEIKSLADLTNGSYGILEPKESCDYTPPSEIEIAVIPCVTCDPKGHRLGYGGGYYDRYMENTDFVKAVLCRTALLSKEIPTEAHDISADIVVTDRECFSVNRD